MNTTTYTPEQALQAAREQGYIILSYGVYLQESQDVQAEQECWAPSDRLASFDFTSAPFWILTDEDATPVPVYGDDDEDLIAALANA